MKRLILISLLIPVICYSVPVYSKDLKTATLIEWEKLNAKVVSLYKQGNYELALATAQSALQLAETEGGYNHPTVAQSMNNLGLLYKSLGKYEEAERYYTFSFMILQLDDNREYSATAMSLNNLAALYGTQGKYKEAESYYKQSLSIKMKSLGSNHLSVALSMLNIADLYCLQGQFQQAEHCQVVVQFAQLGGHSTCQCYPQHYSLLSREVIMRVFKMNDESLCILTKYKS